MRVRTVCAADSDVDNAVARAAGQIGHAAVMRRTRRWTP